MPDETSVISAGEGEALTNEEKGIKLKAKRERRVKPNKKGFDRLTAQALSTLYQVMTDEDAKPSDRLSAVKTALDYVCKFPENGSENALTVVFENIPKEYAE